MWDTVFSLLYWLIIIFLIVAVIALAAWMVYGYLTTGSPTGAFFGSRPERRLGVVDYANVDGRRRLVLVRRDDVEHLIMTGGPVDMVIETGILRKRERLPEPAAVREPDEAADGAAQSLTIPPRPLGQSAGEP